MIRQSSGFNVNALLKRTFPTPNGERRLNTIAADTAEGRGGVQSSGMPQQRRCTSLSPLPKGGNGHAKDWSLQAQFQEQ